MEWHSWSHGVALFWVCSRGKRLSVWAEFCDWRLEVDCGLLTYGTWPHSVLSILWVVYCMDRYLVKVRRCGNILRYLGRKHFRQASFKAVQNYITFVFCLQRYQIICLVYSSLECYLGPRKFGIYCFVLFCTLFWVRIMWTVTDERSKFEIFTKSEQITTQWYFNLWKRDFFCN
jgi:hypothetical protein